MEPSKNHNFWKEFVSKNDKSNAFLAARNNNAAKQNNLVNPTTRYFAPRTSNRQPLRLVGGADRIPSGSVDFPNNYPLSSTSQQRLCDRCQMVEYNLPYTDHPEICLRCHGVIAYHVFRCCSCGLQPHHPGPNLFDMEQSKDRQISKDDDDLSLRFK